MNKKISIDATIPPTAALDDFLPRKQMKPKIIDRAHTIAVITIASPSVLGLGVKSIY